MESEALAKESAKGSHSCDNISPPGSAILTPLSETWLCEAVIINPITALSLMDLNAAKIPTLYTQDSNIDASALNPDVPYDKLTSLCKIYKHHQIIYAKSEYIHTFIYSKIETLGRWEVSSRIKEDGLLLFVHII